MSLHLPRSLAVALLVCSGAVRAHAHAGPPFPIVEDRKLAGYSVSIWTDPDATDDGTRGGQFWVIVHAADGKAPPAGTRITVSARPRGGTGGEAAAGERAVNDATRWFAAVRLGHEGPWTVGVDVTGPLGAARLDADVDATYDLRPPPGMLALYALPFLAVAFLWLTAVRGRRRYGPPDRRPPGRSRPA